MTISTKAIPIEAYPESAWRMLLGTSESSGDVDPQQAYRSVAAVYRCVQVRAKAVRKMPVAVYKGKRDISETPDGGAILAELRPLLYRFEASVCVYGAAYALKEIGRMSGVPRLRWVTSASMEPLYSPERGIAGFERTTGETKKRYKPEQVVYAWHPDLSHDVGPDVAPVEVALHAAGVLVSLDVFLDNFFSGGAIRATLLKVKGNPRKEEKEKLESWWRKQFTGVKNAFSTAAVTADVEPVMIGDSLKDTINVDLIDQKVEEILIAMEVPASLVLPDAANYATARQDTLNFYELCAIPETTIFLDALNAQYYMAELGVELVALPERLEIFQSAELEKAGSLVSLAGVPVLTQSEARQRLELPPIESDVQEQERLALQAQLEVMQAAKDAGYNTADAARIAGLPQPSPEPQPVPMLDVLPISQEEQQATQTAMDRLLRLLADTLPQDERTSNALLEETIARNELADMERWRKKSVKRGGLAPFESLWIDPWLQDEIRERVAHGHDYQTAFYAFKAGTGLTDAEQRVYDALENVLGTVPPELVTAILEGQPIPDIQLGQKIQAVLLPILTAMAQELMINGAEAMGVDLDPTVAASRAADWAAQYVNTLITKVDAQTAEFVQKVVSMYHATPGMDRSQVTALLRGVFSARRAEMIAITEATRAASAAQSGVQAELQAAGFTVNRVWQTVKQDVCPICRPLDGKGESVWGETFPDGPPGHPRCRCAVTLEVK